MVKRTLIIAGITLVTISLAACWWLLAAPNDNGINVNCIQIVPNECNIHLKMKSGHNFTAQGLSSRYTG